MIFCNMYYLSIDKLKNHIVKSDLTQLYKGIILQHNKTPYNYEKRPEAQYRLEAYNPVCGDKFELFLNLEDDIISQIHFHGYGCTISKASTSVLAKKVEFLKLDEAISTCHQFFSIIHPDKRDSEKTSADEEIQAFIAARSFPGRLQCASLSWDTLYEFLKSRKAELS